MAAPTLSNRSALDAEYITQNALPLAARKNSAELHVDERASLQAIYLELQSCKICQNADLNIDGMVMLG